MKASLFYKLIGSGATPEMLGQLSIEEGRARERNFLNAVQWLKNELAQKANETPFQHISRLLTMMNRFDDEDSDHYN